MSCKGLISINDHEGLGFQYNCEIRVFSVKFS